MSWLLKLLFLLEMRHEVSIHGFVTNVVKNLSWVLDTIIKHIDDVRSKQGIKRNFKKSKTIEEKVKETFRDE